MFSGFFFVLKSGFLVNLGFYVGMFFGFKDLKARQRLIENSVEKVRGFEGTAVEVRKRRSDVVIRKTKSWFLTLMLF